MILRSRPSLSALVTAVAAACVLAVACSNQGEGDRCDTLNGNDDCQSGLVCFPGSQFGLAADIGICCPADRSKSTPGSRCATGTSIVPDAGTPETGPTEDGGDAATDTGTDAGNDVGVDAPADAPDGA